jgi:pyrimidine deaminase RibD-like protein
MKNIQATNGLGNNPPKLMVGSVIVYENRIIGKAGIKKGGNCMK